MSSMNKNSFIFSFLMRVFLSWFSCFITLARPSRTAWNRNGQSGHACLVLDLRGNQCFTIKFNVSCGFLYIPLSSKGSFLLFIVCCNFKKIKNQYWIFLNASNVSIEIFIYIYIYIFKFVNIVDCTEWFSNVKPNLGKLY